MSPIQDAIQAAGGAAELARRLSALKPDRPPLQRQHITNWRRRGVPAEWCLALEEVSGVSRHLLLPLVFGPAPDDAPSEAPPQRRAAG